ncbi:hypothetical protein [Sphingosinicella sp. CPCC 101087]|uniref:hypothetical protein n=1 Tax=Sphingosinicella sp. CPCC 101087 TaxID=2497754 RepID=UPI00101C6481|nr:hypothetical protein [Sphingosinicella sp. CPCC 101087]
MFSDIRPARLIAVPLLLAAVAVSVPELAASRPAAASRPVAFVCEGGVGFSVRYFRDRARISTSDGSWVLGTRPSSVGRKFQSGRATFIHDHDMAALNGLPGGPFRACREAERVLTGVQPAKRRR